MKKPPKPLVTAVLAFTVGCTTMQPAVPRAVEPGQEVRVHLAAPQHMDLASVTVRDVVQVDGRLTDWNGNDEALVFSTAVRTRPGVMQPTQGEILRIPEANIRVMEEARVSAGKTTVAALLGGGVVAGLLLAIAISGSGGGGGDGGEGPGGTTGFRAPIGIR